MSLLLVLLVCVLTCCGQLCQKQAVECWKSATLPTRKRKTFGWLALAVAALGLGLLLWLWALQLLPLSVAYPMLSLNFVLMALAAHCFFHETLSRRHMVGIACIVLGVVLLGISL
ncbi:MAG: 4-amino-4-deoxy-L-arabinose-phosphoundecaprenol flippase subunit ArnE [Proteobacteria bacterium]|nr:4-amino-4-deoxy-L-arabinose-phosphoundecaprenol flippase subunit ArnE [Pseudomonadota bacterium]MCL2306690.1 4-amino-4-deoxy-L-arabinose-phosphoundecaprenol flippase subunit ArnE [Pseudomonadota bacterium]